MKDMRLCLLVTLSLISLPAFGQPDDLVPHKWDRKAFHAYSSKNVGGDVGWHIFRNARGAPRFVDATTLIEEFEKEPEKDRKAGLIVMSQTYVVPFTIDERKYMTEIIKQRHEDEVWKKEEKELFAKLIAECEARKIRLLVNSSMDVKRPWKVLVGPKDPRSSPITSPGRDERS